MGQHKKRSIAAFVAALLCVGVAAFTQWGFDPASWSKDGRLMFSLMTIFIAGAAYTCPIWED